ncbi:MAG: hypothetical protein ACK5P6_11310 [Pseudobdellovibrionaceae bacterium]
MKKSLLSLVISFCVFSQSGCSKSEDSAATPADPAIGKTPDGRPVQKISDEVRSEFTEFAQDFSMIYESSQELRLKKVYASPSAFSQSLKSQSCAWNDLPDQQGFSVSGAQCPLSYKSSFVTTKNSEQTNYRFETELKTQASLSPWTSVVSIELQGQGTIKESSKESSIMSAELKSAGLIQTQKRKWSLSQFSVTQGGQGSSDMKSLNSLLLKSEAGEILFQISQDVSHGQLRNTYFLNGQLLSEEAGSLLADQLISLFFIHRQ